MDADATKAEGDVVAISSSAHILAKDEAGEVKSERGGEGEQPVQGEATGECSLSGRSQGFQWSSSSR